MERVFEEGFYHFTSEEEPEPVLVHGYFCSDMGGQFVFGFNTYDGGMLLPLSDLRADTVVTPVNITEQVLFNGVSTLEDLLKIQCSDGNWNYDPYMHGMANGMLLAMSLFKGGECQYMEAPPQWLRDAPNQEVKTTMNEQEIENEIQEKDLNAPRLTPAKIDACAKHVQYHQFVGTTTTVCCILLTNGFTVVGESACASADNFDVELGQKIAFDNAREKIWLLEGYLLKQEMYDIECEMKEN